MLGSSCALQGEGGGEIVKHAGASGLEGQSCKAKQKREGMAVVIYHSNAFLPSTTWMTLL